MSEVDKTLAERGSRYGDFTDNAEVSQAFKAIFNKYGARLKPLHREALDFFAQKMCRILNGDPDYIDNWHDIQGFAKLVEDRLAIEQAQWIPPAPQIPILDDDDIPF